MSDSFDDSKLGTVDFFVSPYLSALLVRSGFYINALRALYEELVDDDLFDKVEPESCGCEMERCAYDCYMEEFDIWSETITPIDDIGHHTNLDQLLMFIIRKITRHQVLEHLNILLRKKAQSEIKDDYGRKNSKKWDREVEYFAREVVIPIISEKFNNSNDATLGDIYRYIESSEYFEHLGFITLETHCFIIIYQRDNPQESESRLHNVSFSDILNGHDYESRVSDLFNSLGWNSRVTPKAGDNGADIIAERNGKTIVIQCKFYSSPVGNKSVQEVYSANGYYDGDHACVVTNMSYTTAAKYAAAKLGVALLHHEQVKEYLSKF